MMEIVAIIPTLITLPHLNNTKALLKKIILLLFGISNIGCVDTVVTFKCLDSFLFLLSTHSLKLLLNCEHSNRILYDMRNVMHLALVILEETNLDIYNII